MAHRLTSRSADGKHSPAGEACPRRRCCRGRFASLTATDTSQCAPHPRAATNRSPVLDVIEVRIPFDLIGGACPPEDRASSLWLRQLNGFLPLRPEVYMGQKTGIEWTDSTWNPVTGCTRVSRGCDNCYAAELANRLLKDTYRRRVPVVDSSQNRHDPFAVRIWPERLSEPQGWASPRRVFVNSMSDLFHADIPEHFVRRVFEVMLSESHHIYQILTKRPGRAIRFWRRNKDLFAEQALPRHIWLGTSVEDQDAVHRVRQLQALPAVVRFLSCEPLLGPLTVPLKGISWVIAGGESGTRHRPMDLDWARELRDQCVREDVPFFFKQIGGRTPKARGRLLDGRTWDEVPFGVLSLERQPALSSAGT